MKRTLFDDRNPERWTLADRKRIRPGDRLVVSSRWKSNPAGMVENVQAMPTIQPGILYWDGTPADVGGYNENLAVRLAAIPESNLVAGAPLLIWKSDDGRQELRAFDVSNLAVTDAWIKQIGESFPWTQWTHFDYATSLGWLAPDRPVWAWKGWDSGYSRVLPLKYAVGQQYHITPLSPFMYGQFVEEYPTRSGKTLDYYREVANQEWCFEIRYPMQHTLEQRTEWLRFIEEIGAWVSWGRLAQAGVGLDEALIVAGL